MTQPHDLKREVQAHVYKSGDLAATLTRTPEGVAFSYTDEWVAAGGAPVASTLPVVGSELVRPSGAVPAFFEGLLPEGRRLSALRRSVKTSADDELSLLIAVGPDTVGDVMVVPANSAPLEMSGPVELAEPSSMRFADLLADAGIHPQRGSLPGVQDKVSGVMLSLPVAVSGGRCILKLNPPEFAHLVENEDFFLRAARTAGLRVVDAQIVHDSTGEPGLLINRFDRVSVDDHIRTLAVEDGCQVLNRAPADKYNLTTEEVFGALADLCDARTLAVRELFAQLVFAYVSGNGDAHAKNFSVMRLDSGEWRVCPAYDLPSSRFYGDVAMALMVGPRAKTDLGAQDFLALASELRLPERAARAVLREQAERVSSWSEGLDELPFDVGLTRKVKRFIANRAARII